MRFLEERLGVSLSGGAQTPRNAALDILTGRTPDDRAEQRPLSAARAENTPPVMVSLEAHPRFRVERTVPPRWSSRRLLRILVSAALLVAALVALRAVAIRVGNDAPVAIQAEPTD